MRTLIFTSFKHTGSGPFNELQLFLILLTICNKAFLFIFGKNKFKSLAIDRI